MTHGHTATMGVVKHELVSLPGKALTHYEKAVLHCPCSPLAAIHGAPQMWCSCSRMSLFLLPVVTGRDGHVGSWVVILLCGASPWFRWISIVYFVVFYHIDGALQFVSTLDTGKQKDQFNSPV